MPSKKAPRKPVKTKADLEMISGKESLLREKEKRYQTQLEKNRRPQVEKLSQLKETKKSPARSVKKTLARKKS